MGYHERMYSDWYANISKPFREKPGAVRAINVLDKGLVALIAIGYLIDIILLIAGADARAGRFIAVPAAGFVIATAIRAAIDAPRPYEEHDIDPLIPKDTHGKSCPSRHIFSAFIIAFAIMWLNVPLGIVAVALGCVVAWCRIVGGVHYLRDDIAAIALAAACALIGFVLIP